MTMGTRVPSSSSSSAPSLHEARAPTQPAPGAAHPCRVSPTPRGRPRPARVVPCGRTGAPRGPPKTRRRRRAVTPSQRPFKRVGCAGTRRFGGLPRQNHAQNATVPAPQGQAGIEFYLFFVWRSMLYLFPPCVHKASTNAPPIHQPNPTQPNPTNPCRTHNEGVLGGRYLHRCC